MSIKIKGTDVIDDNKNIVNVVDITSSNAVSSNTFIGDGSQLTGVADLGKTFFFSHLASGGDLS